MENKTVYHDMGYLMAESLGLISEYNSRSELRQQLRGRGIASFDADGEGPARDISPGEKPTPEPTPKPKPKPPTKKKVIRKKKKKASKPPTDRQIAQLHRGPNASPYGG
jgi:hypothetical protein